MTDHVRRFKHQKNNMSFRTVLLYPFKTKARFDLDYYTNIHMPLVQKHFSPHGLKSWEITKFSPETNQQFNIQVILMGESAEGAKAAGDTPGAKELADDVANFSDELPLMLTGTVVKSSL
ncbi:hypothetical protein LTR78_010836 [Recurvomyces mirabilis]|uniref:EthD domain-containing protein n=1 Tax=Recurvomyces mirabilis TaxID=574656 RepID=A0AAE0TLY1_9PEZI|nr:hypothetical protein LTR78_010836 [Recurvomyces mirabilis]KAK5149494.1 hypothetical protein LTS14_010904 [Recurvomyces mirabilis]